jgi:hypothetical protein
MADLTILLVHGCIATSLCIAFAGYIYNSNSKGLSAGEPARNIFYEYPFQFVFAAAIFFLISWGSSIANEFVFNNYFDTFTKFCVALGWIAFLVSYLLFLQLNKDTILMFFKKNI